MKNLFLVAITTLSLALFSYLYAEDFPKSQSNGYNPHVIAPDGVCWKISVDNAGVLSTSTCPNHCG